MLMLLIAVEKMGRSSFVDSQFDLDNFESSIRLITEAVNGLLDTWLWTPGTQGTGHIAQKTTLESINKNIEQIRKPRKRV